MIEGLSPQNRRLERTVLGLGLVFIAAPALVLVLNIQITERFFGAKDVLTQSNIGEIIRPKNTVKKKGNQDSAYGSARQGDPVYVGDTVMTGKESYTRVTLSDGSILDLGPETLVKIEPVRSFSLKGIKKKLKITVESGAVKAKTKVNSAPIVLETASGDVLKEITAPPVAVVTPTPAPVVPPVAVSTPAPSVAPVPAAASNAPVAEPKKIALATPVSTPIAAAPVEADEYFETVVTAPTPPPAAPVAKKENLISKIFRTQVEPSPAPVAAPSTPAPVAARSTPAPVVVPSTPAPVPVAAPSTPAPPVVAAATPAPVIQKSSPPAEQAPAFDSEIDSPKAGIKPLLSKVVLTVKKPKTIQVLGSQPKGVLPDDVELEDQSFFLKWKDAGPAVTPPYTVWIEDGGKTEKIVTAQTNLRWNIPLRAEGRIRWWVEVPLRDEGTVTSPKQSASWSFPVPKLASPENDFQVPDLFLTGPNRDLLLTWKASPICTKFEINASKSPEFGTILLKSETEKNFQTLRNPEPGTYYWRVACVYRDDFKLFSKTRSFTIRVPENQEKSSN